MRFVDVAVVGHVEWVEFARVERVPKPGEIAKYLVVWKRENGEWKVLYDCWNSNRPAK